MNPHLRGSGGLSPPKPRRWGFDLRPVCVRFLVDKVTLRAADLPVLRCCPDRQTDRRTVSLHCMLLLPGQMGEAWEPSKKQCCYGNRRALRGQVWWRMYWLEVQKISWQQPCTFLQAADWLAASRRLFAKAYCVISICLHWVQLLTTAERGRCSGVETDSRSAGHEITRILRIPKVHYRVHNSPSDDSRPHPTPCFFEVRFNIIRQAIA